MSTEYVNHNSRQKNNTEANRSIHLKAYVLTDKERMPENNRRDSKLSDRRRLTSEHREMVPRR